MAATRLETRCDEVGNLFGRLNGTEYPQEVIMNDTHIDTILSDDNLDGELGALAAWLAIDSLKRNTARRYVRWSRGDGRRRRQPLPYVFWGSEFSLGWRILTTCAISVMPKEIVCRCDEGLRIYSFERPTNSASGY